MLEQYPELGAPMMGRLHGYRNTSVGAFRIVYRVSPSKTIEVGYLRNCRRAPVA